MKFWGAAYTWGKNGNPLRLGRFKQLNFQLYHCCESFSSPTDHWHVFTSVKRPQCFCFVLLCLLCLFLKGGIKNVIFAKRLHFFVYFKSFIYSILHDYSAPQPSVYISNISNTRDSVSSGYPNTEKRVENTTRSGVFLTNFEVFG